MLSNMSFSSCLLLVGESLCALGTPKHNTAADGHAPDIDQNEFAKHKNSILS